MTTIPNLNIVIQQGNIGNESQQLKNHPSDPQTILNSQQPEKEARQQTTVQETPEKEAADFQRDSLTDKDGRNKHREQEKKKRAKNEDDPDSSGYVLDTFA